MANDAKAIDAREDPAQGEPTVEHEQTLSASSSSAQDELIDQHSEDTTHQSMGQATESMSSEGESVNTEEEKNPPKRMTNLVIAQDLRAFKEEVRGQINHLTERIDAIGNYLGMAATAHNGDDKVEDALPNDDDTHQFGAFGHEAYGTEHDTSYGYEEFEPEPATTYESDTKPYTEETPWSPTTSNGLLERLVACLCGEEVSSEPVEVLRARSGSCASLRVQTCLCPHGEVSYGCRAGTDTLEGLEITVIGHRLADTVRVDSDGIVEFNNLDNGQYLIRVDTPEGYSIGSVIVDDQPIDGPHDPHDFNIDEHTVGWWHLEQSDENTYPFASASFASNGGGDEQENVPDFETDLVSVNIDSDGSVINICFVADPAELTARAFWDAAGTRDWRGQSPIHGVTVDVYQGQQHVGCMTTGADGSFNMVDVPSGLVTIVPRSVVNVQGRTYRLASSGSIVMHLAPGSTDGEVLIPFTATSAEILVGATAVTQDHNGADIRQPLTRVEFALYRGHSTSPQHHVQSITVGGRTPRVFSDLSAGEYTLVVTPPGGDGGERWHLDAPATSPTRVTVEPGGTVDLSTTFVYRQATGSVIVTVVDEHGHGIEDIDVVLWPDTHDTRLRGANPMSGRTESDGEAEFRTVRPGTWIASLEYDKVDLGARGTYVVDHEANGVGAERQITVAASSTNRDVIFHLAPEVHGIHGEIKRGDQIVPHALVEIFDEYNDDKPIAVVAANEHGYYKYLSPRSGSFWVRAGEERKQRVTTNSLVRHDIVVSSNGSQTMYGPPPGGGGGASGQAISDALREITAFPLLSEDTPTSARMISGPSGSAGSVSGLVEQTMRQIIGLRARTSNPKAFVNALNQAFVREGTKTSAPLVWKPRTYAVEAVLDGGVTGAQASLHTRMQAAVDAALPLLDGLYALRGDVDDEDTAAVRSVVKNLLNEIVEELGIAGGPRTARVDQLFTLLLGPNESIVDADAVAGQIGALRRELGLRSGQSTIAEPNHVNTIDEEQNVTNFLIFVDYIAGMRTSWIANRAFFGATGQQPFFGTQLVHLQRQLAVISESIEEVRHALNSVFIGPAERQTISLSFYDQVIGLPTAGTPPGSALQDATISADSMFVEELLAWVADYAAEQGPRLIEEGGKIAVGETFLPIAITLRNLVYGALQATNANALPAGFRSQRVRRALEELATQLHQLALLAFPIAQTNP